MQAKAFHLILGTLLFSLIPAAVCQTSTMRVVVYGIYNACPSCPPPDPAREAFLQYFSELKATLGDLGVIDLQLRWVDLDPEAAEELDELYQELGVPKSMRRLTAVSVDEKFLFVHVPVEIIADFLANHAGEHERIVVFKDDLHGNYRVMDEEGHVIECDMKTSITECLGASTAHLNPSSPWSTLSLVLVSGLLDGINPCAFAVLLFLVAFLFAVGSTGFLQDTRRRILRLGSVYIIAVYIAYVAIGLTLLQAIAVTPFPHLISRVGALVLIVIGLVNIKERLWPGRGISLKLSPHRWATIRKMMKRTTIPATLLLGTLVALFEFPCTGGIYFAILGVLAVQTTFAEGLAYLLLYNLAFVLPLIIILALASNKKIVEFSVKRWEQREEKHLRLLEGAIYIGLGAFLLLSGLV